MCSLNYIPMVRANAAIPLVEILQNIGCPVRQWMQAARVPLGALEHGEALIPAPSTSRLIELAVEKEDLGLLGVMLGKRLTIEQLGTFGAVVASSMNLLEALRLVSQFITAQDSSIRIGIETEKGGPRVCHYNFLPPGMARQQVSLVGLMALLQIVRLATGPHWMPAKIGLQFPYFKALEFCEEFAGVRLLFDQPHSFIELSAHHLTLPLSPPQRRRDSPREELIESLVASAPGLDLQTSLSQAIHSHLRDGRHGIKSVSASVGLSVRTLQRRLSEQEIQYSMLVDQVRYHQALKMMAEPTAKIMDIARELGFRDNANFTRAFRRWTGVSPTQYRKNRQEESPDQTCP